jgi:MoaA/NifB/PqqE/SkfB family radical SAM enzyme
MLGKTRFSKISPTFCVFPWMEQVVQPSGMMSFCCVAQQGGMISKESGAPYRAGKDRMEDAKNSPFMRNLRRDMLEGKKIDACRTCYFQESIGKKSYRQMHNEEWGREARGEILARIEASKKNDYAVSSAPIYLDLRLGNLCNLKCRSCNPYNSSQIFKETTQLMKESPEFENLRRKYEWSNPVVIEPWFETDKFWSEVHEAIPFLKKVYLTGGEPTLIQKNYEFLQRCVDTGYSKNIFLMFNTNCTNVQERFLELLPHFKWVLMNASIDSFGKSNDYIRHLSRWESIDRNFQKLLQVPGKVKLGVTPVIQIYNILEITNLLDYVEEMAVKHSKSINVDFLYATSPVYIDASILPQSIKSKAKERLEAFVKRSRFYGKEDFLTNSVDSCMNLLGRTEEAASEDRLRDFLTYTKILDDKRGQDFKTQFEELHGMLAAEGWTS